MTEWYEKSFGEDYLLVYQHRDMQGAEHEVHNMVAWLKLEEHAKVLDLCCGMGRHSLVLAEAGNQVTGVDLSDELLAEAKSEDEQGQVRWLQSDMRRIPVQDGEFDAVLNLFTSFGYFTNDKEHIKVLEEIRRVLKPNGKFIIDFLNPAYVKRHLVPASSREAEGQQIEERRVIENGYVKKEITITSTEGGGEPRRYNERVKLYTCEEFRDMIHEAGLIIDQIHGSYDEDMYDPEESPRMIFVGRCPGERA
ncbi:class I SAM-dependent methyltransferase [Paenibacillus lemnae]|uniref:Class I SAM-dependent methyltransferase n=1 Tax=Paenibacillus lemnae TaxID=1330551 RepID=A0A848M6P0_PAELE|nr:class I SAM-dependent methyltransferase [Paenibacillus lemnae]NMO95264.1 class I SAM-dependent methyltransferase [Paenibacillus lemnae]